MTTTDGTAEGTRPADADGSTSQVEAERVLAAVARRAGSGGVARVGLRQLDAVAAELGVGVERVVGAVNALIGVGLLSPRRAVVLPGGEASVTAVTPAGSAPAGAGRAPLPAVARARAWARTDGQCWYCGAQTVPWRDFRVDHAVPVVAGGGDGPENLVPCCDACNAAKGGRDPARWRDDLERELAGAPRFDAEQRAYLDEVGWPEPPLPLDVTFWFEREGRQMPGAAGQCSARSASRLGGACVDEGGVDRGGAPGQSEAS